METGDTVDVVGAWACWLGEYIDEVVVGIRFDRLDCSIEIVVDTPEELRVSGNARDDVGIDNPGGSPAADDGIELGATPALSALITSAAYPASERYGFTKTGLSRLTFSAIPYTTACRCAAGINGMMPASATLRFCVPYTLKRGSTTPPCARGSIAHVPLGWNSVRIPFAIIRRRASSSASTGGTNCAGRSSTMGGVARMRRLKRSASTRICMSTGLDPYRGSMVGGWNGSAELISQTPRENGRIRATVKLPMLLLMISHAPLFALAS